MNISGKALILSIAFYVGAIIDRLIYGENIIELLLVVVGLVLLIMALVINER